jgi:hypothetical protein
LPKNIYYFSKKVLTPSYRSFIIRVWKTSYKTEGRDEIEGANQKARAARQGRSKNPDSGTGNLG